MLERIGGPLNPSAALAASGIPRIAATEMSYAEKGVTTPEQVAYMSRQVTLQPGDVIATGSPAGVGLPRGEFLQAGDECITEIEGCGVLRNRMVR